MRNPSTRTSSVRFRRRATRSSPRLTGSSKRLFPDADEIRWPSTTPSRRSRARSAARPRRTTTLVSERCANATGGALPGANAGHAHCRARLGRVEFLSWRREESGASPANGRFPMTNMRTSHLPPTAFAGGTDARAGRWLPARTSRVAHCIVSFPNYRGIDR